MSQFHLTRGDFAQKAAPVVGLSPDQIAKAGNRKNKADAAMIQDVHDKCAALVDKMHCAAQPFSADGESESKKQDAARALLEKVGKRHSASDMAKIKEAHDAMCALGAQCVAEPEEGAEPKKDSKKEDAEED